MCAKVFIAMINFGHFICRRNKDAHRQDVRKLRLLFTWHMRDCRHVSHQSWKVVIPHAGVQKFGSDCNLRFYARKSRRTNVVPWRKLYCTEKLVGSLSICLKFVKFLPSLSQNRQKTFLLHYPPTEYLFLLPRRRCIKSHVRCIFLRQVPAISSQKPKYRWTIEQIPIRPGN